MTIKSFCTTKVITIQKKATLEEVANQMQKHHVGSLIVTEELNGKIIPVGIITDRDIALCFGSLNKNPSVRVEHIMQTQPVSVNESEGVFETIKKMQQYGIKRIPVVHEDGSLAGIVCSDDLLTLMGEEISNLSKINEVQINNEKGVRLPTEKHI